jgi:hypothetical protein
VDWLSVLKTKPWGRVEVVQDENEDTSVRDEVFQVSDVVEPYRVAPSIELEENLNFHVFDDSLVDVDAEELNFILSSSGQANIDEEDDIHIKDCDEGDDNSIDDEEEEVQLTARSVYFFFSFVSHLKISIFFLSILQSFHLQSLASFLHHLHQFKRLVFPLFYFTLMVFFCFFLLFFLFWCIFCNVDKVYSFFFCIIHC